MPASIEATREYKLQEDVDDIDAAVLEIEVSLNKIINIMNSLVEFYPEGLGSYTNLKDDISKIKKRSFSAIGLRPHSTGELDSITGFIRNLSAFYDLD